MPKRTLSLLNQWRSRVFAVETGAHVDPVYFALSETPQPSGGRDLEQLFGGGESYSLHLDMDDRIQRAMHYGDLRRHLISGLQGSAKVWDISSFCPGMKRYVPAGGGHHWCQEVLSPAGDGRVSVAEQRCVVPAKSPADHPSTLDIVNSSVFYSFQEAYKVLTEV
ncbi:UMP-CMP kinase 2, mitochondrial [Arapaima gigas]